MKKTVALIFFVFSAFLAFSFISANPKLPKEAIKACKEKEEFDACTFTTPMGDKSGKCMMVSGSLACMPEKKK